MNGKTHVAGGLVAGILTVAALAKYDGTPLSFFDAVGCVVVAGFGSLIPDIDLHRSKIGNKTGPLSILIHFFFGHRTFFHSPLFLVLSFLLLRQIFPHNEQMVVAIVAGMASHLFLDALNKAGIPLLYPYPKRFWIIGVKTGSAIEGAVMLALYGLFFLFGITVFASTIF